MPQQPVKPIEEIVREVGRYPLEAFVFVQECIGIAAEHVHGPMTAEQAAVARWMTQHEISHDELNRRCDAGDLPPDIAQSIERVGGIDKMNRHVTGQQLCWAIRDLALQRWGMMARSVLARWNVTSTEDIGQIVFALVENDWLQKQPEDSIDDFQNVFRFEEQFDGSYQIEP